MSEETTYCDLYKTLKDKCNEIESKYPVIFSLPSTLSSPKFIETELRRLISEYTEIYTDFKNSIDSMYENMKKDATTIESVEL